MDDHLQDLACFDRGRHCTMQMYPASTSHPLTRRFIRTLDLGAGDGLRLTRFGFRSCSSFITLLTPVSHEEILLLGIRPAKQVRFQVTSAYWSSKHHGSRPQVKFLLNIGYCRITWLAVINPQVLITLIRVYIGYEILWRRAGWRRRQ